MLACGLAMIALTVGTATAADDKVLEQLKARLDALEQQNKDLMERVKVNGPYQPVYQEQKEDKAKTEKEKINKQVDAYLKEKDTKKKGEDEAKVAAKEAEGHEVGKQLDRKSVV